MLEVSVDALSTPVIRKLSAATDAVADVLVEAEKFRHGPEGEVSCSGASSGCRLALAAAG